MQKNRPLYTTGFWKMCCCVRKTIIAHFLFPVNMREVKTLIVDNIRALCEKRGISIWALERATGIGNGVIARWSNSFPSVKNLKLVADYFGVTVDSLLE